MKKMESSKENEEDGLHKILSSNITYARSLANPSLSISVY